MFTSATTYLVLSVVLCVLWFQLMVLIDIWQRIEGLWFWIFL